MDNAQEMDALEEAFEAEDKDQHTVRPLTQAEWGLMFGSGPLAKEEKWKNPMDIVVYTYSAMIVTPILLVIIAAVMGAFK